MKAPTLLVVALVAVAFAGVAHASAGPLSPLCLAHSLLGNYEKIVVIQGGSVNSSFLAHYNPDREFLIAEYGDVRTAGEFPAHQASPYDPDNHSLWISRRGSTL